MSYNSNTIVATIRSFKDANGQTIDTPVILKSSTDSSYIRVDIVSGKPVRNGIKDCRSSKPVCLYLEEDMMKGLTVGDVIEIDASELDYLKKEREIDEDLED